MATPNKVDALVAGCFMVLDGNLFSVAEYAREHGTIRCASSIRKIEKSGGVLRQWFGFSYRNLATHRMANTLVLRGANCRYSLLYFTGNGAGASGLATPVWYVEQKHTDSGYVGVLVLFGI